jgi:SAM-dependent methyltransferase
VRRAASIPAPLQRHLTTDLAVLERMLQPRGKRIVDIGCGDGRLVRQLGALGADVIGVEISAQQLGAAIADDDGGEARYLIGRAQELPLEDGSVDVALFMRTLHHVPPAELTVALNQARRVLRDDGAVYVAEPLATGDYFELTRIVDDEREVRAAAQEALARAADAGLERVTTFDYDVEVCVRGIAGLRQRIVSVDPDRADIFDARIDELTSVFARRGERGQHADERCFLQPMRADLLKTAGRS